MSKNNSSFWGGLALGILAGIGAKVVMDNKEEILEFAVNAVDNAKNEIAEFVDYAQMKMELAKMEIEDEFDELREDLEDMYEDLTQDDTIYIVDEDMVTE